MKYEHELRKTFHAAFPDQLPLEQTETIMILGVEWELRYKGIDIYEFRRVTP